jgi:hypothetical protein
MPSREAIALELNAVVRSLRERGADESDIISVIVTMAGTTMAEVLGFRATAAALHGYADQVAANAAIAEEWIN